MEKTTELRLTNKDLADLKRRRSVCVHCGGVYVPEDEAFVVCEPCVKEAMEQANFNYTTEQENTMKDELKYKDLVDLISTTDGSIGNVKDVTVGRVGLKLREFINKDKYCMYMHVGPRLVESHSGPKSEIHKGQERIDAIRKSLGPVILFKDA